MMMMIVVAAGWLWCSLFGENGEAYLLLLNNVAFGTGTGVGDGSDDEDDKKKCVVVVDWQSRVNGRIVGGNGVDVASNDGTKKVGVLLGGALGERSASCLFVGVLCLCFVVAGKRKNGAIIPIFSAGPDSSRVESEYMLLMLWCSGWHRFIED